MKKHFYFLLVAISTILFGCSADDTSSEDDSNLGYLKFGVQGGFNYETAEELGWNDCQFDVNLNNDGTKKYTIISAIKRVGNNPLFEQDLILVNFEFDLNEDIQINQIIPIENISDGVIDNNLNLTLPYDNDNYDYIGCNLELEKQSTSTGFLKITQITNDYVYGEFQFSNLQNLGGYNLFGTQCQNYPTQQNYNIVNGTFKALK
jgi:hypothetical protein